MQEIEKARSKKLGRRDGMRSHLPAGLSAESIQAQLDRILRSKIFAKSKRLIRFLRFTIERVIHGEVDKIKEFLLGIEVFDRKDSFDPRLDSIVRVEANRLRSRLQKYYETEGLEDPILIQYQKGSYVPVFVSRSPETDGPAPSQPGNHSHPEWRTIAVLPFADLSPEKDQEFFCDGMTEELINALSRTPGLRVVAPRSVFQFKGKAEDVRKVGRDLGVDTVLEGSVRKAGGRLRITANLVEVSSGYVLWSETYERMLKDVFAIQQEISRAIVDALSIEKTSEPARSLWKHSSENLEAYHHCLKGRYLARKLTEEGLTHAVKHLEQAVALDFNYGLAWAGLAKAYGLMALYAALQPREFLKKAKVAALKALEIDEGLAEVHAVLGLIRFVCDWEWEEAEQKFKRAAELNPADASVHNLYGLHLACNGRLDDAAEVVQRAHTLDPISLFINTNLGWVYHLKGEYTRALEQYRKTLELHPNSYLVYAGLGLTYEAKSMTGEALAAFERSQSLSRGMLPVVGSLGHCLAATGSGERASELLEDLRELSERRYGSESQIALIYMGFGRQDLALESLKKAVKERDPWLVHLKVDPRFVSLRSSSDFNILLKKVGLQGEKQKSVSTY